MHVHTGQIKTESAWRPHVRAVHWAGRRSATCHHRFRPSPGVRLPAYPQKLWKTLCLRREDSGITGVRLDCLPDRQRSHGCFDLELRRGLLCQYTGLVVSVARQRMHIAGVAGVHAKQPVIRDCPVSAGE